MIRRGVLIAGLVAGALTLAAGAHTGPGSGSQPAAAAKAAEVDIDAAVARAAEFLLQAQEGEGRAEWPYEGVYRVRGQIPIGYRVGGTAICATALLRAPGYEADAQRREAVARACEFVCRGVDHPLMSEKDYDGGYDVRGWGYTYGLAFLLELKRAGHVPEGQAEAVEHAIAFYIDAIQKTEIPQAGGWNYARPPGRDTVAPASSFMTAPTLQALFEARRQGYAVDEAVVERGLGALRRALMPSGAVVYSGEAGERSGDGVPGAVGRMVATQATLALAGRATPADVRAAVDAFIVHWEWLEKRRARPGTHQGPYGIAPYYFYYAHYYAAQAIELLPRRERPEYRRRLAALIFATRSPEGTWNHRVFPRSAAYGTAMSSMALLMPRSGDEPARWDVKADARAAGPGAAAGGTLGKERDGGAGGAGPEDRAQ
mgnify:CR=1 FL=1